MPLVSVLPHLPEALREEITKALAAPFLRGSCVSEIRMRTGRVSSLSLFRGGRLFNLPLSHVSDKEALSTTFSKAVGGSLYAFEERIKEGYVSLPYGVRVGVAGKAASAGDEIVSLVSVDSLVFRLPSGKATEKALFSFFTQSRGGLLLFAPPGGGKTSLLRSFAARAAKDMRVCIVDTREEFFFDDPTLLLDLLRSYPKARGAEIAVRTLSPELLILDEVGVFEVKTLASLVSFGVRTVASVHGESAVEILHAPALAPLLRSGLFSYLWDVKEGRAFPIEEGGGI